VDGPHPQRADDGRRRGGSGMESPGLKVSSSSRLNRASSSRFSRNTPLLSGILYLLPAARQMAPLFVPSSTSSRPTQRNADARFADYSAELKELVNSLDYRSSCAWLFPFTDGQVRRSQMRRGLPWFRRSLAHDRHRAGSGLTLAKAVAARGDLVIEHHRRGEQPEASPRTISQSCRWR
jgi:hypothetical protein